MDDASNGLGESRGARKSVRAPSIGWIEPCPGDGAARTAPAARPLRVGVLGAGLAGLAAALELSDRGHDVVVFEAQERVGGRVLTLREGLGEGLYADAGAMAFSDDYRHFLRLVRRFELPFRSLEPLLAEIERRSTIYHLRGRRIEALPGAPVDWPHELTAEERGWGRWGIVQRYLLDSLADAPLAVDGSRLPAWAAAVDATSLAELLRSRGASDGAVALVKETFWFGHWASSISAATSLLSDVWLYYFGQEQLALEGGSDRLPAAIAAELGPRIRRGVEVVSIEQTESTARVAVRERGGTATLEFDRVVCALPLTLLRSVEWRSALSDSKAEAIVSLALAHVTRVFLQFRRRHWADGGANGASYTDLAASRVLEQPLLASAVCGERRVLESYVTGSTADRLDRMSVDERTATILGDLELVHPGISAHFEIAVTKSWASDRWAGGAYTQFRPGEMTKWLAHLQAPEGRIHFAGEHTSTLSGTLEGALESGARAAREVDESE